MLNRLRTFVVVVFTISVLTYITLGATLANFKGSGVWTTSLINSGLCPPKICNANTWQQ